MKTTRSAVHKQRTTGMPDPWKGLPRGSPGVVPYAGQRSIQSCPLPTVGTSAAKPNVLHIGLDVSDARKTHKETPHVTLAEATELH